MVKISPEEMQAKVDAKLKKRLEDPSEAAKVFRDANLSTIGETAEDKERQAALNQCLSEKVSEFNEEAFIEDMVNTSLNRSLAELGTSPADYTPEYLLAEKSKIRTRISAQFGDGEAFKAAKLALMAGRSFFNIPIDQIDTTNSRQLDLTNDPATQELVDNIIENDGNVVPIEVILKSDLGIEDDNGQPYSIVFGSRRTQCSRLAKKDTVWGFISDPEVIKKFIKDKDIADPIAGVQLYRLQRMNAENTGRKEETAIEKADHVAHSFETLKRAHPAIENWKAKQAADRLGYKEDAFSRLLSVSKIPQVIRDYIGMDIHSFTEKQLAPIGTQFGKFENKIPDFDFSEVLALIDTNPSYLKLKPRKFNRVQDLARVLKGYNGLSGVIDMPTPQKIVSGVFEQSNVPIVEGKIPPPPPAFEGFVMTRNKEQMVSVKTESGALTVRVTKAASSVASNEEIATVIQEALSKHFDFRAEKQNQTEHKQQGE